MPNEPERVDDAAPDEPGPDPASPPDPSRRPARTATCRCCSARMRAFARFDRAALARFCAGLSPGERLRVRAMLAVLEGKARERDQPPEPWLRPGRRR